MNDHSQLISHFKDVKKPTREELQTTIKVLNFSLEVLRTSDDLKGGFASVFCGKNKMIDPILALIDAYEAGV